MPFREASVRDAGALARIHVAAWQVAYRGVMPAEFLSGLDEARSKARWVKAFAENPPLVLVVEHESNVVGACRFGASRDEDASRATGEVMALNVDPATWRRGFGTELLNAVLKQLRGLGFSTVTLWVLQANTRARAFYEAAGFSPDGVERTDTDLIGAPLDEVRYRISLGQAP